MKSNDVIRAQRREESRQRALSNEALRRDRATADATVRSANAMEKTNIIATVALCVSVLALAVSGITLFLHH